MRSSPAVTNGSLRGDLTALRRPAIFLHFFDVHFLEEKGVDKYKEQALDEARKATRLAILLADEVLVPGASYVESSLCAQVLNEFPPELFSDQCALVGSGASFDEFVEEKQLQYRTDQAQGLAYRAAGLGIKLPWRTRKRSATADIASDWTAALASGEAERLFRAAHGELPKDVERRWEAVPERLGGQAFIVDNVMGLLFDAPVGSLIVRNRLHAIVNRSYFGSYGKDVRGSVFRNMTFLESPGTVPSGDPDGDVDYRKLILACRDQGVLRDIVRARPSSLMALRDDQRFAAAYAAAHPAPLPEAGQTLAEQPRKGYVPGTTMGREERALSDVPRVLIVTALPKEAAAVLATFDEWHPAPGQKGDPNVYREGVYRMDDGSERRVLLASLPSMGNASAAAVAVNAFRTHDQVVYALMVGIAGACPHPERPDEHVRLGDVVVSNSKGVFDYGHVKRTTAGDENRGSHQRVSAALLGAYDVLASEAMLGHFPWESVLTSTLAKSGLSTHFHRPGDDKDVLRVGEGEAAVVVPHPEDPNRRPGQPKLHGGAIGTADILLKDPTLREHLRDAFGARAVEMESGGMQTAAWLANREFIVVRGTCDYADPHKNDDWQHYAALAAASVARCLIARMPAEWFA